MCPTVRRSPNNLLVAIYSVRRNSKKNTKNIWRKKNYPYICIENKVVFITNNKLRMDATRAYEFLNGHGIKPSAQRVAIMEYLMVHKVHPSVDEIYNALIGRLPTLSKTTVNNTLRLFREQGAALMLTIDERQVCFDGDTTPHGHFLCRKCNKVFDITTQEQEYTLAEKRLPHGFKCEQTDIYFRGICPECSNKK